MIYDIKIHLPQLMEKMIEDFRIGDITKLETDKTIASKIFTDNNFNNKLKLIEDEHKKRKDKVVDELKEIEERRLKLAEELEQTEKDYWETIIGEITRTINATGSVTPITVENE